MSRGIRYFSLMEGGREVGTYSGRSPRHAALKAANRGHKSIELHERGTEKKYIYKGTRRKVRTPSVRPGWMPAEIWKPNVSKISIKKVEYGAL